MTATLRIPLSVPLEKSIRDTLKAKKLLQGYKVFMERGGVEVEAKPGDSEKSLFNRFMEKKRGIRDREFGLET